MRQRSKILLIALGLVGVMLIAVLAVAGYQLRDERDRLAAELDRSEHRGRLLNEKYREEKAAVGRLQRENLMLEGRARQAVMDMEGYAAENARLEEANKGLATQLATESSRCENRQQSLAANLERWREAHEQLNERYRQAAATLATREKENKTLQERVRELDGDLLRANQQGQRYRAHNVRLCEIARGLVGQIEREKLGSTIIVREPVMQFKRVELEQLLQEYLDRIDDEQIVN